MQTAGSVADNGGDSHPPVQPVQPGQPGGRYRPLSEADLQAIYAAALQVLENLGMGQPIEAFITAGTKAGCWLDDQGRLHFPPTVVQNALKDAAKAITVYGFSAEHDLQIAGERVHFGTGGAAVHMYDPVANDFALSTLADLKDLTRLYHHCPHLHFFVRPIVARDMEDARALDLNTAFALMSETTKPVGTSFFQPEHVDDVVAMADILLGGDGAFRQRPFIYAANTFVVPPLRFAEESCACLVTQVRAGMTPMLISASQAGATSPAALAGTLTQALAECLAGLTLVNLLSPGHPVIVGMWPFVSDLRSGAMSGGSGEQALLAAASAQLLNWLDLPSSVPAGMTDAKQIDNQAGYEKGVTVSLAAMAGANMIHESASMLASILSSSREGLLIDNDMLGMISRTVRGIEVTADTLSVSVMADVVHGEGHFLGHDQTLGLMQSEYLYPAIADRLSPKEWEEQKKPHILAAAQAQVKMILEQGGPDHVSAAQRAEIKKRFALQ